MTNEEINAMEAGRKMDVLIAETIMGFQAVYDGPWTDTSGDVFVHKRMFLGGQEEHVPEYSTRIWHAWDIVEWLRELGYSFDAGSWENVDDGNNWQVAFEKADALFPESAEAPTMPLAICRAALKAVTAEVAPPDSTT